MGAWLNRLIREAEARGRQEGFEQGFKQGFEQGFKQGFEQGFEQGFKQGFEEGRQEGAAGMLRRSLQIRFGPLSAAHEDRLQQLTAEEAEEMIHRVFSAGRSDASIDEVFAG